LRSPVQGLWAIVLSDSWVPVRDFGDPYPITGGVLTRPHATGRFGTLTIRAAYGVASVRLRAG